MSRRARAGSGPSRSGAGKAASVALALALALACEPGGLGGGRDASGFEGLVVRGRVVDAESCAMLCEGVAGVSVRAAGLASEETGPDGAFVLRGLPEGTTLDLEAVPGLAGHLQTLNPALVAPSSGEVFNVRVHVLPEGAGSLVEAVVAEAGVPVQALHVGQVVREEGGGLVPVEGATATLDPALGPVRYVNVLPRFGTMEAALLPPGAPGTGRVGMFVVTSPVTEARAATLRVAADPLATDAVPLTLRGTQRSFTLHLAR